MRKKMLIFGGAGSLGTELTKKYVDQYDLVICSRDEAKHFFLRSRFYGKNIKTIICDVREQKRVYEVLLEENPEIVIIAQALKQVDICEKFPIESVQTNILGVSNIVESIKNLNLSKITSPECVCFISTDKSAAPSTIYGMCKSIAEKLVFDLADHFKKTNASKAIICRYGNVICSKGSIIPALIKAGIDVNVKEYSLTHIDMDRFIMSLPEAVQLIGATIERGKNAEMWVPRLRSMRIVHLMEYFGKKYNKPYKITGIRECEKIHELMLTLEEAIKVKIDGDYFIYSKRNEILNNITKEYSSADHLLTYDELSEFMDNYLASNQIIE